MERAPFTALSEPSFRVIADRWRDTHLSAIGAFKRGGRYNAPHTFRAPYTADSQMKALLEAKTEKLQLSLGEKPGQVSDT